MTDADRQTVRLTHTNTHRERERERERERVCSRFDTGTLGLWAMT